MIIHTYMFYYCYWVRVMHKKHLPIYLCAKPTIKWIKNYRKVEKRKVYNIQVYGYDNF